MKIVAILNENGFCIGYELSHPSNGILISYSDARSGMYGGRKYDKQNKKWLDEYDEDVKRSVRVLELPNYIVLQLLESNIIENEERAKKRVAELEEQNLNLQEGLSSIYEDRASDQLEVQAALAALYEKIIELKGE